MKKKKKVIIVLIVIFLLLPLIPIVNRLKDGGSIEFRSILYNITKYKVMTINGYDIGWKIEIFGTKIYEKIEKQNTELEELFNLRNQYFGNNSNNIKLLDKLEISKLSKYTIKLETSNKPYVLFINFDTVDTANLSEDTFSKFKKEMKKKSIILLSLIENLDEVHYNDRFCDCIDNIVKLKSSDLEKQYGNIKEYGKTIQKFKELFDRIQYNE